MNVFRLFFALSWTVGPALAAWVCSVGRLSRLVSGGGLVLRAVHVLVVAFVPHVPPSEAARQGA